MNKKPRDIFLPRNEEIKHRVHETAREHKKSTNVKGAEKNDK
jgi:hypothetical protein